MLYEAQGYSSRATPPSWGGSQGKFPSLIEGGKRSLSGSKVTGMALGLERRAAALGGGGDVIDLRGKAEGSGG